jgi:drug/metabolite transporter (DMT)-like permease
MSVAALTLPVVDGAAKYLSSTHSPLYIAWARYALACAFVVPVAMARYRTAILPREQMRAHLLRTVFLVAAMSCYFLAIARIPLATAISAFFVAPIIAMMLAVVFLGEALTTLKIATRLDSAERWQSSGRPAPSIRACCWRSAPADASRFI